MFVFVYMCVGMCVKKEYNCLVPYHRTLRHTYTHTNMEVSRVKYVTCLVVHKHPVSINDVTTLIYEYVVGKRRFGKN